MWKIILIIIFAFITYNLLTNCIEEYTLQDDPKIEEIMNTIAPLFSKNIKHTGYLEPINKRDILNEISIYKGNKSYTINKEKVFLCLKKKTGEYYDMNILVFVTLHELSHVLSTTIGHDQNFNNIFDALLQKAAEMKIYNPDEPIDRNYCLN